MGFSGRKRVKFHRDIEENYPRYYLLYDHGCLVSCICLPDADAYADVLNMIALAVDNCTHDLPDSCMRIKKTNYRRWKEMH